ncbi:unnamed protein product [Rangifer tarandus platyrhynchus]|uniref:Uncharacterized protein n=2 Tax=Rangifer tarandus platyrhynchus TaxID=3082113 RepID=A0ABN8Y9L7_RANTA|nr:unnamed protein product [Rangifer tarandus platyrhynchus]CAI9696060.1 unnamed protein product [Rangifer tarandus platyrhynchus]
MTDLLRSLTGPGLATPSGEERPLPPGLLGGETPPGGLAAGSRRPGFEASGAPSCQVACRPVRAMSLVVAGGRGTGEAVQRERVGCEGCSPSLGGGPLSGLGKAAVFPGGVSTRQTAPSPFCPADLRCSCRRAGLGVPGSEGPRGFEPRSCRSPWAAGAALR